MPLIAPERASTMSRVARSTRPNGAMSGSYRMVDEDGSAFRR